MFCFVQVRDDGLPRYLCENCVTVLTQFYNFVVTYEQSLKQLKELLQTKDGGQDLDGSCETNDGFENEEGEGGENVKGESDDSFVVKEEIMQEDELEGELKTRRKLPKF